MKLKQGNLTKKNHNNQCTRTSSIDNVTNRKRGVSETLPYGGQLNKNTRLSKSKEKERRKEIGLDFLNKIPKKKIEQLVLRQRTHIVDEFQHIHPKLSSSQQREIQQYQKKKSINHQKKKSIEQQKDIAQHQKIQQNLNKLVAFIQSQKFPKKRSVTKYQLSKKTSTSKTRNQTILTIQEGELIEKYKQLQERYSKLFHSEYDESCCVQYITDTEMLPSQNTSQNITSAAQDISLNNEERIYLKEFGKVEKELISKHQSAIKIQKAWRGFIARKKLLYSFFNYPKRQSEIVNQETFRSSIRLDRYSQSIQQGKEDTLQQLTHQTDIQMLLDLESEQKEIKKKPNFDKFVRFQKMKWQEMLSYISNLQKEDSKRDLNDVLQDLKQFTQKCSQDCSLTKLTKLEIKVPQFSQESIVMSEIRQAMCSEKMIRKTLQSSEKQDSDLSIFDQNPFQEFTSKKINELINMDKMNELLKIREQVINERRKSEQEILISQFNDQLISPKTFQHQNSIIEKWVSKQQKNISDHKKRFEKGWKGLYDTFISTQKDVKFLIAQKSQTNSICSEYQSVTEQTIFQGQNQDTFLISQSNDCGRMKTMTSKSPSPYEKQPIKILDQQEETIEWDDEYLLESESVMENKNGLISIEQLMQGADQEIYQQAQSAFLSQLLVSLEIDLLFYELLKHNIDITKQSKERRPQIQEGNSRRVLEAKFNRVLQKQEPKKQEFRLRQMSKIQHMTKEEQLILNQFHQELLEILQQKVLKQSMQWLNYDSEKFDVILDLDQMIFDFLLEEFASELKCQF